MKKLIIILTITVTVFILLLFKKDSNLPTIGILQFATHQDLDDAKDGFIESLENSGFTNNININIILEVASSDMIALNMQVKKLIRKSDLVLGIGTPAVIALKNTAIDEGKNIPILFTAVTDPVSANLVPSLINHNTNISGTTDLTPIKEQIALIKDIKPNTKKIGVFYTASEVNSQIQASIAKKEIENMGLMPIIKSINSVTDIDHVLSSLTLGLDKVDAIYIPSDNLISSSMGNIQSFTSRNPGMQVPIIGSTTFQVEYGASVTLGISYKKLGLQTGQMAAKILNGANIQDLDVESVKDLDLAINLDVFELIGLNISKDLINKADIIYGGNK